MTDPSSSSTGKGRMMATIFECSVCLESLDTPASLGVEVNHPEGQAAMIPTNGGRPMQGSSRGRGGARGRKSKAPKRTLCPTDVVTIHCGHVYHKVCLEKWFSEKGKRTCPSCRIAAPAKNIIQLFPSTSVDANLQLQRDKNEAGPNAYSGTATETMPATATRPDVEILPATATRPAFETMPAAVPIINIEPFDCNTAVSVPRPGGTTSRVCDRQGCRDLNVIHNTLINDFNDLQTRFGNLRDDDAFKIAQIQSLEEDNASKDEEILRLQRELHEIRTDRGCALDGSKRRRL